MSKPSIEGSESGAQGAEKRSGPWFAIVVALLVLTLLYEGITVVAGSTPLDLLRRRAAIRDDPITYLGIKNAPVQIEFYAPHTLPWHKKTLGLLKEYNQKQPGRIYVTLLPIGNSRADALMNARGFSCAVTFINGEHEFALPGGRHVDLQKRPNNGDGSSYNSEDVITVLDNLELLEKPSAAAERTTQPKPAPQSVPTGK